ncbi:hypothetical protein BJY00DRAFT_315805 [Aspergillus carlsbadensis]|nr:hypothetical protein BJY00DRAFT_315805 [Aspergillus carlsbadensis]
MGTNRKIAKKVSLQSLQSVQNVFKKRKRTGKLEDNTEEAVGTKYAAKEIDKGKLQDAVASMIGRVQRSAGNLPSADAFEPQSRTIFDLVIVTGIDETRNQLGASPTEIVRLIYEEPLTYTITSPNGPNELSGRADYCIGYGGASQGEANLAVIVIKKPKVYGYAHTQLLAYMATVLHCRRKAGKPNPGLYGITSDGEKFTFYRMNAAGQYAWGRVYEWEKEPQEVFTFICYIIRAAVQMSPTTTKEPLDIMPVN